MLADDRIYVPKWSFRIEARKGELPLARRLGLSTRTTAFVVYTGGSERVLCSS